MTESLNHAFHQYTLSLAAQTNAIPLPSVPEVFGVRIPASPHVLSQVDFDLVANKPPPQVKQYDEEVEEVEEDDDEDEDTSMQEIKMEERPAPNLGLAPGRAFATPSDADMASPTPAGGAAGGEEGSEGGQDEEEGLFGDDDSEGDEAMESVEVPDVADPNVNGIKRKLVEDEDYD